MFARTHSEMVELASHLRMAARLGAKGTVKASIRCEHGDAKLVAKLAEAHGFLPDDPENAYTDRDDFLLDATWRL